VAAGALAAGGHLRPALAAEVIARAERRATVGTRQGFFGEGRSAGTAEAAVAAVLRPAYAADPSPQELLAAAAAEEIFLTVHPAADPAEHHIASRLRLRFVSFRTTIGTSLRLTPGRACFAIHREHRTSMRRFTGHYP
jgi:hypothetical protein